MGIVIFLITMLCIVLLLTWVMMQPQSKILQGSIWICFFSFITILIIHCLADFDYDLDVMNVPMAFKAITSALLSLTNGVSYSDVVESSNLSFITENSFYFFIFETLFWICHFLFVFTVALGGFALLGRRTLDKIRRALHMRFHPEKVYHIFGDTYGALLLGRNIAQDEKVNASLVVIYMSAYTEELHEDVAEFSGALIEVTVEKADKYLKKAEKNKDNIAVFAGIENVTVNDEHVVDLFARHTIHELQPTNEIRTIASKQIENGELPSIPARTFVIVGFGELGQACAKWLLINGQNSDINAKPKMIVIEPDTTKTIRFQNENPCLDMCADVQFLNCDVFSGEALDVLKSLEVNPELLPEFYIAITPVVTLTQEQEALFLEQGKDVAEYLREVLLKTGSYPDASLDYDNEESSESKIIIPLKESKDIWTYEVIFHKALDRGAIFVNGFYSLREDELKTLAEKKTLAQKDDTLKSFQELAIDFWGDPGSFNGDSSRAAADFWQMMCAHAGIDPAKGITNNEYIQKIQGGKSFASEALQEGNLLDELGKLEHYRWNAFHVLNGYRPLSEEDFTQRVDKGEGAKKPQLDKAQKFHACITDWDKLDALDEQFKKFEREKFKPLKVKDLLNVELALCSQDNAQIYKFEL